MASQGPIRVSPPVGPITRAEPLGPEALDRLEPIFGTRLGAVRVHRGPGADRLTSALGVAAFTSGTEIFLGPEVAALSTDAAWFILGHETRHALHQGTSPVGWRPSMREMGLMEAAANRAGIAVLAGATAGSPWATPLYVEAASGFVQAFNSWEHQVLEDASYQDLQAMISRTDVSKANAAVARLTGMLKLWQSGPTAVTTPDRLQQYEPNIQTVTLAKSGYLVTAGEINALADYAATPDALDAMTSDVVGPLVQQIRQETYNTLRYQAATWPGGPSQPPPPVPFTGHIMADPGPKPDDTYAPRLAYWTEQATISQAPNDYYGLLAKNACHFAPFAWYRFATFREVAQNAIAGSGTNKDPRKGLLNLAFANHFLTDCFAAGHLTNKTLMMQWFIDYLSQSNWGYAYYVAQWEKIRQMTAEQQGGLFAASLYPFDLGPERMSYKNVSVDPQTVTELPTYALRRAQSSVVASGDVTLDAAYQQYWALMSSSELQFGSKEVHDYFNGGSLMVVTRGGVGPFRIWGDGKLFDYSNSINPIIDALAASYTPITNSNPRNWVRIYDVVGKLPYAIADAGNQETVPLVNWHDQTLKDELMQAVFGSWSNLIQDKTGDFKYVSVDQGATPGVMTRRWQWPFGDTPRQMLLDGLGHLWVATSSAVSRFETLDGAATAITGAPGGPLVLASDGQVVLVGGVANGQAVIARLPVAGAAPTWTRTVGGTTVPGIACTSEGVYFAASGGKVWAFNDAGARPNPYQLPTPGQQPAIIDAAGEPSDSLLIVYQDGWLTALKWEDDQFFSQWQKQVVSDGASRNAVMYAGDVILLAVAPQSGTGAASVSLYDVHGTPLNIQWDPPAPVSMPVSCLGRDPIIIGSNAYVFGYGTDLNPWGRQVGSFTSQNTRAVSIASDGLNLWYVTGDGSVGGLDLASSDTPQPTNATASLKGGSSPSVIASDGASVYVAGNGAISAFAIGKPA